jgi:hypothetical protein
VELTHHPLAAHNVIFGVSNFFVLPLPSPWELVRGPLDPEVDRQVRRAEISWVQDGRAMYLLVHRAYRATIEIRIAVRPRRTPIHAAALPAGATGGHLELGGHPAAYRLGEQSRGWWPRKRISVLETAFYCDPLGREIGLELLEEEGEEAHLREMLQALPHLQCH